MLLSLHIPKTAGTSFRIALQERLGSSMLMAYRGRVAAPNSDVVCQFNGRLLDQLDAANTAKLVAFCQDSDVSCIHGHFAIPALDVLFESPRYITFVREPLARLVSAFNHMQVTMPDVAERLDFGQFIRREQTQNLYEQLGVLDHADQFDFIGVTEQYDRSLALLGRTLPVLDGLAATKANVAQTKRFTSGDVSDDLKEEVRALNAADFEIYDIVLDTFEAECAAAGL